MIINGKYENAKVFTEDIETEAITQIKEILDDPISENYNIRIMPDVHAGKGIVVKQTK